MVGWSFIVRKGLGQNWISLQNFTQDGDKIISKYLESKHLALATLENDTAWLLVIKNW